jgi:hypothetical protein
MKAILNAQLMPISPIVKLFSSESIAGGTVL